MIIGLFIPKHIDQAHWLPFKFDFQHLFIFSVCTQDSPPSSSPKAIFHSNLSSLNFCSLSRCPSVCLSLCCLSSLSSHIHIRFLLPRLSVLLISVFMNASVSARDCLSLNVCVCEHSSVNVWRWMYVSQSDLHPPEVWLIEPAVETRRSHTLTHTYSTFTLIYSHTEEYFKCSSLHKSHFFFLSLCLWHFLWQKWASAHERPSPTVDPTIKSLTPPPLFGSDGLSILYPSVAWCLCICILPAVILSLYLPLSPPFSHSLLLFYYLSFCLCLSVFLSPSG